MSRAGLNLPHFAAMLFSSMGECCDAVWQTADKKKLEEKTPKTL